MYEPAYSLHVKHGFAIPPHTHTVANKAQILVVLSICYIANTLSAKGSEVCFAGAVFGGLSDVHAMYSDGFSGPKQAGTGLWITK